MSDEAPKPVGTPPKVISLEGKKVAFIRDAPVLLKMPGTDAEYLPCFTTAEQLLKMIVPMLSGSEIIETKSIHDVVEFFRSVPHAVTIIVDPYFLPNGRVRFAAVQRPES